MVSWGSLWLLYRLITVWAYWVLKLRNIFPAESSAWKQTCGACGHFLGWNITSSQSGPSWRRLFLAHGTETAREKTSIEKMTITRESNDFKEMIVVIMIVVFCWFAIWFCNDLLIHVCSDSFLNLVVNFDVYSVGHFGPERDAAACFGAGIGWAWVSQWGYGQSPHLEIQLLQDASFWKCWKVLERSFGCISVDFLFSEGCNSGKDL